MTHIGRNIVKNIPRAPWPEPYADRRGCLHGNVLAIRNPLFGRLMPERILEL